MILLGAAALAVAPGAAGAHSGDSLSSWLENPVAVDGVHAPGEWSDAASASFSLCSGTMPAQIHVKNDGTHLFVSVVIDDIAWPGNTDFLTLRFDDDHDGVWEVGENLWIARGDDGDNYDSHLQTGPLFPDTVSGGTNDLAATVSHTNPVAGGIGTYTVEYRGLLDSADDAHDFSLASGDVVGVAFVLSDGPFTPGCSSAWPSSAAGEFANLVIADADADDDGVPDEDDTCPGHDDAADADADGTPDGCDVCPLDPADDADLDGICESDDNCPTVENANQSDVDGDGVGDACETDTDGDLVIDDDDNCPFDVNPDQSDGDGDGAGDVCDGDSDGDGVLDASDTCLGTPAGEPVLPNGCAIAQECSCTSPWKNHGSYVSCVSRSANALRAAGAITSEQKAAYETAAAQSSCGAK